MENSLDETETHQSLNSPPKRRRSTFFVRRDSIVPQPVTENVADVCKKTKENENRLADMSRYYEKLLQEKDQWKKEATERRNKYHDLRLQFQMTTKAPNRSRLSYAALTNEDIEFLNAKPNLAKLVENAQKLHDTTKLNMAFVRRSNELEDVALEISESRVNKIIKHILENSSVGTGD